MVTKRARTWLARATLITVIGVVGALAVATWSLSGTIAAELLVHPLPSPTVTVLAIDGTTITVTADERSILPGRWALVTATGRAVLGNVEAVDDGRVQRRLFTVDGVITPGMTASFETTVYTPDPEARGVAFAEVILERPYGDAPAWVTTGSDDTWVIFAHDFGADRTESLRVIALFERLGLPVVIPTLRSDDGAIDEGRTDLGPAESHDVIAAIEFALGAGAQDVVLFGSGTGASSVLLAAADIRYGPKIAALVLDAPLLDPAALADLRLGEDKVPGFLIGWAKASAAFRFGIDWTGLDHVAAAADQSHPTLIFHGEADERYPAAASERYVVDALDATLVLVPEAGHGEAWNLDPVAYEGVLEDFLRDTAVGPAGTIPED
ncbi:MAG: hypothetical protein AAB198_02955, partial [Actinomycetota bacterium]